MQNKELIFDKQFADFDHPLLPQVKKLLLISDFAISQLSVLRALLLEDECQTLLFREDYFSALNQLSMDVSLDHYLCALRQFRNKHFLRLLLLELAGLASTEEVMRSWSDCADALILHALAYCQQQLRLKHGIPQNEAGKPVQLYVIAMGKLGGRELNYSSDVDLIFAFSEGGDTDGENSVANSQYFSKIIQNFVHILQQVTVDGFVFRVDLRLRPNGESGPLVFSLSAMETYYQEQGRDWERYAMVKARVITKAVDEPCLWFDRLIKPFVYRRYVDFSVIESLRSMKSLIEREVRLNPRLDDIKRGQGGIREIEFIIQNVQLIRGGRIPQLQTQNALQALAVLKQQQLMPRCGALRKAYLFLRQLENALQSLDDKQTHALPVDAIKQAQIALAMGFASWEELLTKLNKYQRIVSNSFKIVLGKVEDYEDEKRLLTNQLASLWQGRVEETMAINLLASLGFENAEQCYQMIYGFRTSKRCTRLSQAAHMRLDHFMVKLLTELAQAPKTHEVLVLVMHLLDNIVGRSAYLALLTENPQALKELLFWLATSPFITSLLSSQPFLLEVLLTQDPQWKPPSRKQLRAALLEQLAHNDDLEAQEEILRQFKLTQWLIAARAEVYASSDAVRIGQFLADLAEVIVIAVLDIACQQLSERYPEILHLQSSFAIIAYGKLGSREMNYTSDLDLVFLHAAPHSEEALVTRLTQKIVHMLTTRSRSGILYAVDTRLRPSGAAGLLVSHVGAFITYQKTQAWTWEHQALLKARVLSANQQIQDAFQALKLSILTTPRDKEQLQQDVLSMRAKVNQYQDFNPIKHAPGGLLDLEFLVQFLVLSLSKPEVAEDTHTLHHLHCLAQAQALNQEQVKVLKQAYKLYHSMLHKQVIQPGDLVLESLQQKVKAICDALYHLN